MRRKVLLLGSNRSIFRRLSQMEGRIISRKHQSIMKSNLSIKAWTRRSTSLTSLLYVKASEIVPSSNPRPSISILWLSQNRKVKGMRRSQSARTWAMKSFPTRAESEVWPISSNLSVRNKSKHRRTLDPSRCSTWSQKRQISRKRGPFWQMSAQWITIRRARSASKLIYSIS